MIIFAAPKNGVSKYRLIKFYSVMSSSFFKQGFRRSLYISCSWIFLFINFFFRLISDCTWGCDALLEGMKAEL